MLVNRPLGFLEEERPLNRSTKHPTIDREVSPGPEGDTIVKEVKNRPTNGTQTRLNASLQQLSRFATPLTLAVVLGLWQLLTMLAVYPTFVLPTPAMVFDRFLEVAASGDLWRHAQTTIIEAGLGFGVAFLVAGLLCYPIARSRLISALLSPLLAATQAMPLVAIAPLLVIWFGFGILPKVVTCALIVFFPLLLNAVAGLKNVDKSLREAAEVFGANRWQALWFVELPLALPTMLTGIKIGFTVAITGAVVGEFISADSGLGYLLNLGRGQFDTSLVFVALLSLTAIAMVAYGLVGFLEKRVLHWQD
jgi:NitT/TauT family transport system permease protein